MPPILQTIAKQGVEGLLKDLVGSPDSAIPRTQLETQLLQHGATEPTPLFDEMVDAGLIQNLGSNFAISRKGHQTALLIDVLHGGDVEKVYEQLRQISGLVRTYELVRQGMTTRFFQALAAKPMFGRLFVCSPWINPSEKEAALLQHAIMTAEKQTGAVPDVHVITRPLDPKKEPPSIGLKPFHAVKATIYMHPRLHSKLYIRDPAAAGGTPIAIVGSENLTQSNNFELGIQINGDGRMVAQLIAHFWELTAYASEG